MATAAADLEQFKASAETLLSYCAENELDVPQEMKEGLLGVIPEDGALGELGEEAKCEPHQAFLRETKAALSQVPQENELVAQIRTMNQQLKSEIPHLDLRVKDGKFVVINYFDEDPAKQATAKDPNTPQRAKQNIQTFRTESSCYKLLHFFKRCVQNKGSISKYSQEKVIMDGVNLYFEPGKMYLVLGGPGSGKSTLLKMIANNLATSKDCVQSGQVSLSGVTPSKDVVWSSLVAFMDQIDRLHPFLTVFETCEFAWKCRTGGTHRRPWFGTGPEVDALIEKMNEEKSHINLVLQGLGLTRVKDTFVGDQEKVRGVSGGEKKRVTIAEMLCVGALVLCCDEISTGLDAATTFDITRLLGTVNRMQNSIKIVSLLQPPPETVANFDELVVLSEGKVIYSGPLDDVVQYFNSLGYEIPERMDVADWLQTIPTKQGADFLVGAGSSGGKDEEVPARKHLTTDEFVERFYSSSRGKAILERLETPVEDPAAADIIRSIGSSKYANSTYNSLKLLSAREGLLWWRDKYQIKAKVAQAVIVGIVAGTLFWQTESVNSIISILFQSMFYACVAQMTAVVKQFPSRSIYYKQADANFFPTVTYVAGRSLASIPTACIDAIGYGTVIYFFVGLAYNDGASIANYFVFLLLVFSLSLSTGLFFSMYSAMVREVTIAQACMAITAVLFVLFSGFTVQPDVIPGYWIWFYWINFFAWALRGLAVNEFDSGKYDEEVADGVTQGEQILTLFGFTLNGEPFTSEWKWYAFVYTLAIGAVSMVGSTFLLEKIRFTTGKSLVTDSGSEETDEKGVDVEEVAIPFTKVNLTFKNVHYTVVSSITNENLELLKGIDGYVEAGKLTALMGSSGAGKTTLMDVLALRKTSGEIEGEVLLNGHPVEEESFRRCIAYVEQFDIQSAQLTIRETVQFSAKLRLEEQDSAVTEESITKFVDQTLDMLELTNEQDLQVGSDEAGGLSFEQKKRLSIAVEVVANPSILFLDEPTSGLDARAALVVMRGLKRIAVSGRAVCATIHQPSIAIFADFDSLLLLKRGGETVFFGALAEESSGLISYFERYPSTPKIKAGENPATWMLTTTGAGSSASDKKPFDYAGSYTQSTLRAHCLERIDELCSSPTEENRVSFLSKYATSSRTQSKMVFRRLLKVYFRSPSYNSVRMIVSGTVALLFASVYASQRVPENEADLNSRVNSLFVAVLFLAVNAVNTVLKVFETERNMFYRHKAANMYGSRALVLAFTFCEIPFVFLASTIFVMLFYWIMGFRAEAGPFFLFYLFFTLTLGAFSFIGQMLSSLFRDSETSQGFGALFIMSTSFFGGILIRPSEIPNFWIFMYWLFPGHYIFEGMIMSQFDGDDTEIAATPGSAFYDSLVDSGDCTGAADEDCSGTASQWVNISFSDWSADAIPWNALYLIGLIIVTRLITLYALTKINYRAT